MDNIKLYDVSEMASQMGIKEMSTENKNLKSKIILSENEEIDLIAIKDAKFDKNGKLIISKDYVDSDVRHLRNGETVSYVDKSTGSPFLLHKDTLFKCSLAFSSPANFVTRAVNADGFPINSYYMTWGASGGCYFYSFDFLVPNTSFYSFTVTNFYPGILEIWNFIMNV